LAKQGNLAYWEPRALFHQDSTWRTNRLGGGGPVLSKEVWNRDSILPFDDPLDPLRMP